VFFGEYIPPQANEQAAAAAAMCDLMMIIGTSATVAPASYLPHAAKDGGAFIVEINPTPTELSGRLTDVHIRESAGKALPGILTALDDGNI
jgi:NAD-dependent deacetylase